MVVSDLEFSNKGWVGKTGGVVLKNGVSLTLTNPV